MTSCDGNSCLILIQDYDRILHSIETRGWRLDNEDLMDCGACDSRGDADAGGGVCSKEGVGSGRKGLPDRQGNLLDRLQCRRLLPAHGVRGREMGKAHGRLLREFVPAEVLTPAHFGC